MCTWETAVRWSEGSIARSSEFHSCRKNVCGVSKLCRFICATYCAVFWRIKLGVKWTSMVCCFPTTPKYPTIQGWLFFFFGSITLKWSVNSYRILKTMCILDRSSFLMNNWGTCCRLLFGSTHEYWFSSFMMCVFL